MEPNLESHKQVTRGATFVLTMVKMVMIPELLEIVRFIFDAADGCLSQNCLNTEPTTFSDHVQTSSFREKMFFSAHSRQNFNSCCWPFFQLLIRLHYFA